MSLSYESSGVRYEPLDAFKRACQQRGARHGRPAGAHGYREPAAVRGESAYLIEADDHYLAHVEEGLGTKNLVADAVQAADGTLLLPCDRHRHRGHDRQRPRHLRGPPDHGRDARGRGRFGLVRRRAARRRTWSQGFAEGCRAAGAVWGGGETPTLRGHRSSRTRSFSAGSAVGRIAPKSHRIMGDVSRRRRDRFSGLLGRADQRAHALPPAGRPAAAGLSDPARGRQHLRRGAARALGHLRGLRARVPAPRGQAQLRRARDGPRLAEADAPGGAVRL